MLDAGRDSDTDQGLGGGVASVRRATRRYLAWSRRCRTAGGLAGFLAPVITSAVIGKPDDPGPWAVALMVVGYEISHMIPSRHVILLCGEPCGQGQFEDPFGHWSSIATSRMWHRRVGPSAPPSDGIRKIDGPASCAALAKYLST